MALVYCEICGVLIKGQGAQSPEGVICEGCFASRRVVPEESGADAAGTDVLQFACCYCQSLLRLKPVERRTRVRCPQCGDTFYLHADGRIESKFQGNSTAVLQQDQVSPLMNQTMGTPAPNLGSKTQPLRRPAELGHQESLLDELKPKRLEFAESLPQKQITPAAMIDTEKFRTERSLDLLPEGVGPGQAEEVGQMIEAGELVDTDEESGSDSDLSASDDGRLDLDAEGLKRKTGQLRPVRGKRGPGKKKRRERSEREPKEKKEELTPEQREARRKEQAEQEKERARRLAEAERRGAELASQGARQVMGGLLLWGLLLLPLLGSPLLALSATSEAGFATRGGLGRGLGHLGERVERGLRTVNGMLPPDVRLPLPERAAAEPR